MCGYCCATHGATLSKGGASVYNRGMYKDTILAMCALLVFSVPFWGVPADWTDVVHFGLGVLLLLLALAYRFEHRRAERRQEDLPHVDSRPASILEHERAAHTEI